MGTVFLQSSVFLFRKHFIRYLRSFPCFECGLLILGFGYIVSKEHHNEKERIPSVQDNSNADIYNLLQPTKSLVKRSNKIHNKPGKT